MTADPHHPSPHDVDALAADWVLRQERGLTPTEVGELRRWADADPRHAAALQRHARTWSLLDAPRTGGRAGEMLGQLSARRRRRRQRQGIALGAAALLAVMVAWNFAPPERAPDPANGSAVVIAAARRELPDGSVVDLKAGAEIDVQFDAATRRVRLVRGQAHFQVAKNPDRPFVVTADALEVRAVGTGFLVDMDARQIEVLVTEGRVAVRAPAEADTATTAANAAVLLDAGRSLSFERSHGASAPKQLGPDEIHARLAWRSTRLEFTDMPLGDAVELLNRHSSVRLVVADAALARVPVNGSFRPDNTEALLRLLEATFEVSVQRTGDVIILRPARSPGVSR